MRIGKWACAAACAAGLFVFWAGASAALDEEALRGVQRVRVLTMKSINRAMRRIKAYAKKENYERVAAAAEEVALLSAAIPYLSPKGSNFGKTRIKDEVWERFEDYEKITRSSVRIARDLSRAAREKDRGGVSKAFAALAESCSQCHKPYRKKKRGK